MHEPINSVNVKLFDVTRLLTSSGDSVNIG